MLLLDVIFDKKKRKEVFNWLKSLTWRGRSVLFLICVIVLMLFLGSVWVKAYLNERGSLTAAKQVASNEPPRIRETYWVVSGAPLLDAARRGYAFAGNKGFVESAAWLKNEVFGDLGTVLATSKGERDSGLPYDVMQVAAVSGNGNSIMSASVHNYDSPEDRKSPTTEQIRRTFRGAMSPFRGPNQIEKFDILALLHRVASNKNWAIRFNSSEQPGNSVAWGQYSIVGLPDSSEVLDSIHDPISLAVLKRRPSLKDVVVAKYWTGVECGTSAVYLIRDLQLVVLDIENIGTTPIDVDHIKQRVLRSRETFLARTGEEASKALNQASSERKKLPLGTILPKEHVFIPLQLKLGFRTASPEISNYEYCLTEEDLPSGAPQNSSTKTTRVEVVSYASNSGETQAEWVDLPDSVLTAKPDFKHAVQRDYFLGNLVTVDEIAFKLDSGELYNRKLRLFDPNNLLVDGGYEKGSCPILYAKADKHFERLRPLLVEAVGKSKEKTETINLFEPLASFSIREEEPETTFIDEMYLLVADSRGNWHRVDIGRESLVKSRDGLYLELKQGDSYDATFEVPSELLASKERKLVVTGYYMPQEQGKP